MSGLDFYQLHAREKYGLPETWFVYKWECFPKETRTETLYIEVTGMVAPMKKRKPSERDWRNGDKSTRKTCVLPCKEHDEWIKQWEQKTGKCAHCTDGQKWTGWSAAEGGRYKPCPHCNATGLAPNPPRA
jgi:hypothetical protein